MGRIFDLFRKNLIDVMKSKGIIQRDLAKKIGFELSYTNQMLNGSRRFNEDTIEKICEVLGVTPAPTYPPELQQLIKYYLSIPKFRKGIDYFAEDIRYSCKREIAELEHGVGMAAEAAEDYPKKS